MARGFCEHGIVYAMKVLVGPEGAADWGGGASILMYINVYVYFGFFMLWVYINIHKLKVTLKLLYSMYKVSKVRL